jgi:hypothetical protein
MYLRGAGVNILHDVQVRMDADLDPVHLEEEVIRRATNRADNPVYGANYIHIKRAKAQGCYRITFINEEALPVIYDILDEIEADIAAAQEQQRILGLLAQEGR